MIKIELFVRLVIPDTTAITTFHTLKKLGFKELEKIKREDYYYFEVDSDFDSFVKKITKVDVIINVNKHKFRIKLAGEEPETNNVAYVIVKNIDNGGGLLNLLKNRFGFKEIKALATGTFWTLHFNILDKEKINELTKKISETLLYNKHYQEIKII